MAIAGLYDFEETLGKGHFAVVKSAKHVFTGLRVAVKVIDKSKLDDVAKAHLFQEVRCMKLVSHPNIIRLYEVIDTATKLYLILELGDGGDLYDFIMKHERGVDEDVAKSIFKQIANGIHYCHRLHVVHRDLKPENLVFCNSSSRPIIKLTDFGLSRSFMPGEMLESSVGSLEYSAPEILLGDQYSGPSIDVWSLGVILYMLIAGRSPFSLGNPSETLTNIMDGRYDMPTHVSKPCQDLIASMLVVDMKKRATLDSLVHHPWLQTGCDDDPTPTPLLTTVRQIPQEDHEYILDRMELGNFGTKEEIQRFLKDSPYSSISATYFLLAEAELHRRLQRAQQQTNHPVHEILRRKLSVPDNRFLNNNGLSPRPKNGVLGSPTDSSPYSSGFGSAERGVLVRRRPTCASFPNVSSDPTTILSPCGPPARDNLLAEGRKWIDPISSFPLAMDSCSDSEPQIVSSDPDSVYPKVFIQRKLSAFEEEDEEVWSPLSSRGSSRANSRSSSPLVKRSPLQDSSLTNPPQKQPTPTPMVASIRKSSFSKSDGSDDAQTESDEGDVHELLTSSGHRRNSLMSRILERSPAHSPQIVHRSPSHPRTFSDDEGRKNSRNWRYSAGFRRKLRDLRRVDSSSSDDMAYFDSLRSVGGRTSLNKSRQRARSMDIEERLSTEQLKALLAKLRGRMSRESSNGSELSLEYSGDLHALRHSVATRFELSDEEDGEGSDKDMEVDGSQRRRRVGVVRARGSLPCSQSFSGVPEERLDVESKSPECLSLKSDIVNHRSAYCAIL